MNNPMRKFHTIIFLLISALSYAQEDIVEKVIRVRQLVAEIKTNEAFSLIVQIEQQCMQSTNDTLKAVFLELKGQALLDIGNYKECITPCKEAITLFERTNLRQYEYLDAWYIIATAYHRLKDYKNAESYYRKGILRSVTARVSEVNQYRSSLYLNLGNLYKEQGDTLLAEECYKRVGKSPERELIDIDDWNYVDWEDAQWEQVNQLVNDQRYEEAANFYTNFIKTIKERKGNRYEAYLLAVYSRAILLSRYVNNIDDAIPLFEELVNLSDSIDALNEDICGAYCNLALCYSQKGNYKAVDNVISKGLPYLSKANIQGYPSNMIYRFAGNGAYWKQDYPNAIKYYERYFTSNERESGTNYEEITNQLSVSYIFSGHPEKAKDLLERLLSTDEDRLKRENAQTLATVYHNLGRAYMLLNHKSSALKFLTESKNLQNTIYGEVAERTLLYIQECQNNNE